MRIPLFKFPAFAAAVLATVLFGGLLAPAAADATHSVGVATQAAARTAAPQGASSARPADAWDEPRPTVEESAAEVVAEAVPRAGAATPLRVVTARETADGPRIDVDRVRGRADAVAAVEAAQDRPDVLAVDVDSRVHAVGSVSATAVGIDPGRSQQWALDRLAAEAAWELSGGDGVVVAVVDSGVDGTHPDLAERLTAAGIDLVAGGDGRRDEADHGTHVAGVVAAVQGNAVGVAGLAPRARIMPVRVLDADGSGWSSDIARGITYAVDHGADVVNLSLGGPHQDSVTATAVSYAVSKGVTVVAAVGNERLDGNPVTYPAAYPGVLAVASVDRGDTGSSFSNTGAYVDLAAPGDRILSTVVGGYAFMSGTSMAAPFVSAAAALAIAAGGGASASQVEKALVGTATDLGPTGRDEQFGHGLVAPAPTIRAVTAAVASAPTPSPTGADADPAATAPAPAPPAPSDPSPSDPATAPPEADLDEPRPTFASSGGVVRVGGSRTIRVHVTDASDGRAVAGQPVVVVGRSGGRVVVRRAAVTDANGKAAVRIRIRATTTFLVRTPATVTTAAATGLDRLRWRARPRVRVWHDGRAATVRVLDARGQRVVLEHARGDRWVALRVRALDDMGTAAVRGLPPGRIRARITRVPGLEPALTRPWTVR